MFSKIFLYFIQHTQRVVWVFANAYGIRIERPGIAHGQHPLVFEGGDYQMNHQIPRSCYFNTRSGGIIFGKNTVLGEDVKVLTGKHLNIQESEDLGVMLHSVPDNGRNITVGEGCYIGSGAILIGPITIGNFSVVGAGSVVTKSFPERVFVAGNPAKLIKHI
jgi:acetyltransferase-like isoleucine patch superfamily enzyme